MFRTEFTLYKVELPKGFTPYAYQTQLQNVRSNAAGDLILRGRLFLRIHMKV